MSSLASAVAPAPISTVGDAISIMRAIDQALPDGDGVKWFNFLYLAVTESIRDAVTSHNEFADVEWILHLDVVFANLYFATVAGAVDGMTRVPRAWRPLFKSRLDARVARIQHALAGMNAHINRDLVVALVQTHLDRGTSPDRSATHFHDFKIVDDLLARVEARVKPVLFSGVLQALDGSLGHLDDVVAMWSVGQARQAAWRNSEALWGLLVLPLLGTRFIETLDRTTGFAGRGLLVPTQL